MVFWPTRASSCHQISIAVLAGSLARDLPQPGGEVFLKSSTANSFCPLWRGRADILRNPSALNSRPTVVSSTEMRNSSNIALSQVDFRQRACRCLSLSLAGLPVALPSIRPSGPLALKRRTQSRTTSTSENSAQKPPAPAGLPRGTPLWHVRNRLAPAPPIQTNNIPVAPSEIRPKGARRLRQPHMRGLGLDVLPPTRLVRPASFWRPYKLPNHYLSADAASSMS